MPQVRSRPLLPVIVLLVAACASTGTAASPRASGAPVLPAGITAGPSAAGSPPFAVDGSLPASTGSVPAPPATAAAALPSRTAPPAAVAVTPRPTAPRPTITPRASRSATPAPLATRTPGTSAAAVTIADFDFAPGTIRVMVGTVVTWTNTGAVQHTVTADGGAFRSSALGTGGTFSFAFSAAGSYAYHCEIHPFMTGTVVVGG